MPRNEKTVKLADRTITVREVRVRKMLRLLPFLGIDADTEQGKDGVESSFAEHFEELAQECCGLKSTELFDLYPSDYEELWKAFQEVNSFFFDQLRRLEVEKMVTDMLHSIIDGVGAEFAASMTADIRESLTMAGAGSSKPLNSTSDCAEKK